MAMERKSKNGSGKAEQRKIRQNRPKPPKSGRSRIPPPQIARIIQRYIRGEGIRKISRGEKRDRETIAKIVRSPEVLKYVETLREQYIGLGELAMDGLSRALIQSNDGRLAHEILRNIGVIPNSAEALALQRQNQHTESATEEDRVKVQMLKLLNVACERAKIFGTPLPTLDEPEPLAEESESRMDELQTDL